MKMMMTNAVLALLCASAPSVVNGHGFMMKPLSRNYAAYIDWDIIGTGEGKVKQDVDHNALNANTAGSCGKTQGNYPPDRIVDYSEWLDSTGKPMPWKSYETYQKGQIIEVEIKLTAEHCGYFTMKGCPKGRGSSKACFDHYPLMLEQDISPYGTMPLDPKHPDRAHFVKGATGDKISKYRFKLPDDLVGEQVLLQWQYWTGNSCWPQGYADYILHNTPDPANYCVGGGEYNAKGDCPPFDEIAQFKDPSFANNANPEIFWNCAEVTIEGDPVEIPEFESDPPPPYPGGSSGGKPQPGCLEMGKPKQDPSVVGTCDGGNVGNGICPNQDLCCSPSGYCGSTQDWCGCAVYEDIEDIEGGDGGGTPPGGGGGGGTPPPPPPPSDGSGCCSIDFKKCDSNLAAKDAVTCEASGSYKWLADGDLEGCFASYGDCRSDMNGCCPGLVCDGNENWAACKIGGRRTAVRAF